MSFHIKFFSFLAGRKNFQAPLRAFCSFFFFRNLTLTKECFSKTFFLRKIIEFIFFCFSFSLSGTPSFGSISRRRPSQDCRAPSRTTTRWVPDRTASSWGGRARGAASATGTGRPNPSTGPSWGRTRTPCGSRLTCRWMGPGSSGRIPSGEPRPRMGGFFSQIFSNHFI